MTPYRPSTDAPSRCHAALPAHAADAPWQPHKCLPATALGYVAATWLGLGFAPAGGVLIFAPTHAFLLCVLLWAPTRRWPFYLGLALPAAFAAEWPAGIAWHDTLASWAAACLGATTAAGLWRRYRTEVPAFRQLSELLLFLGIAVLIAPAVAVLTAAATGRIFVADTGLVRDYSTHFMAVALANLTVAPMLLLWRPTFQERLRFAPVRVLEAAVIAGAVLVLGGIAFGSTMPDAVHAPVAAYACLPLLLWAVARFGLRGAVSASFILVLVASFGAANGGGPMPAGGTEVLGVQLYLFLVSASMLVFAVLLRERDQATQQQRVSERSYREMFNAASDAIFLHDARTGWILDVNDAMLKMYGCERSDIKGLLPGDLNPLDQAYSTGNALEWIRRTLDEGPQTFQWQSRRKDGTRFWAEVSLRASEIGGEGRVLAVVRDITQRRAAEEALRESEQKFRTLFEVAGDAIVLLRGGAYVDCNKKALEMFGATVEDFQQTPLYLHSPPLQPDGGDTAQMAQRFLDAAAAGTPQVFEWRHRRLDGTEFDTEVTLSRVDTQSEPLLQACVRDVTERKRHEAILQQKNQALRQKTEALQAALSQLRANEEELSAAYGQLQASQEEIQQSEERFRQLIESGTDVIAILDFNGIVQYESPSVLRVMGYMPEERRGTAALANIHPEDLDRAHQALQKAVEQCGVVQRLEARFQHKDGSWRILECVGKNAINDPALQGIIVTSRDVTEQRQGEHAIRALAEGTSGASGDDFFRNFVRHLADALDVRYAQVSQLCSENRADTLAVWQAGSFQPNFSYDLAGTPCMEVVKLGRRIHREEAMLPCPACTSSLLSGALSYMGMPLFASDGEVIGVIVLMDENVTQIAPIAESLLRIFSMRAAMEIERKQTEDRLRRLAQVVEQAEEMVVITDTKGDIEYVNPVVRTIMGLPSDELIGKNVRVLKSGKHTPGFYQNLWETIRRGDSWSGRFTNSNTDGSFVHMDATITPLRNLHGVITGYVSTQRNVTHEADLEVQLRQSQKMEAIGTLAGGIAHDFNNLLSAILGYTELAIEDAAPESRTHNALNEVRKAGLRAADLVRQILTFSRQSEQERRPLQLSPVVKEAMKLMRSSLPATIAIQTDIEDSNHLIMGDPTQVHQVILNLCTNAYHAMELEGGTLSVSLAHVALGMEEARAHANVAPGEYVCLSVRDTGHGMDENVKQRIFDPYFTTKEEGRGTGLGLAIVHGIVTGHAGAVTVHSEQRQGTEFNLYFPALREIENHSAGTNLELQFGKGEHLLLVDDEEAVLYSMQKLLERIGYLVTAHLSPHEALYAVENGAGPFDAVLTDHTMPGMTGIELARGILALRPEMPIVLITGMPNILETSAAKETGFRALAVKPVRLPVLSATLRRILSGEKVQAE
jgi:PAS domain S-box-containing protein